MTKVDLKLTRARDLLETAVASLEKAIKKKRDGYPYDAGKAVLKARRIIQGALETIDSTVDGGK